MSANVYDPVTTTDSTQLADDDWGLSLPPLRYKKFSGTSRLKSVCLEVKKHPKCLLISAAVVSAVILLAVIISVASHHNSNNDRSPTGDEPKWKETKQGLQYYPVPESGTVVVKFNPGAFYKTADQPIEVDLNKRLKPYKAISQVGDEYANCNSSYSPRDKVCRITSNLFGEECTASKHYGYFAGQPCILVQLVLPENVKIAPITQSSPLWSVESTLAHAGIHYNPDYIPMTCQGATSHDQSLLTPRKPSKKMYEIYPNTGFPSYIYRPRAVSLPHLRPAVMIRLPSLLDRQLVFINCTVWGELYTFKDKVISHSLLSAQFAVYIDR